jgi:hypothetical protein
LPIYRTSRCWFRLWRAERGFNDYRWIVAQGGFGGFGRFGVEIRADLLFSIVAVAVFFAEQFWFVVCSAPKTPVT